MKDLDPAFVEYVVNKALNTSPQEMVEDDGFILNLLRDIQRVGNRGSCPTGRRRKNEAGGLEFLKQEYDKLLEGRDVHEEDEMP